jgi:hypothetical protein
MADGVGHIMGGCDHGDMKALYIARHNKAVHTIAENIAKGEKGGCYMVMDACAKADTPAYVDSTRLPAWLLPQVPAARLKKMRPDLLLIPTISLRDSVNGDLPRSKSERKQHTVHILEVGYTSDTNHERKKHIKAEQHAQLADLLRAAGWTVCYTTNEAITLGHGGSIRKDLPTLLRSLGLSAKRADRTCAKLHSHAVTSALGIVCCRRGLEKEDTGDPRQPRRGEPPR